MMPSYRWVLVLVAVLCASAVYTDSRDAMVKARQTLAVRECR